MQKSSIYIIFTFCLLLALTLIVKASPANYLTNPSFTGGITDWTVGYVTQDTGSIIEYDSVYYQDTAGSLKGATGAGKKIVLQGYAKQTVGTAINIVDTVKLRLYWSKRSIIGAASLNTIKAQICKPGLDCLVETNWTDIWSDISIPAFDGATAWADTGLLDVDSYFDVDGTYQFRWYFDLESDNAASAQAIAWIDNTALDVIAAPTLSFSISDNTIGFGTLSSSAARFATDDEAGSAIEVETHTLSASTNATSGYIITVDGTTLTYSSYTITAIGGTNTASSPGTEQFGLRMTVTAGTGTVTVPYAAAGFALDTAAFPDQVSSGGGDGVTTTYSVRYLANITLLTEAGNYSATLTYVATGTF